MFRNYAKIAIRNIVRNKGYSFINIFGLACGLAICILIMLWVSDELTRDRHHQNLDNVYRVCIRYDQSGEMRSHYVTPPPLGPTLLKEYPEIASFARYQRRSVVTRFNDLTFREYIGFADPSLFDIFAMPFVLGEKSAAFVNPYSVVITEKTARKYFGETNPVGKIITIENQFDLTVTGIIEDLPSNSLFNPDLITQFATVAELDGDKIEEYWRSYAYQTFVLLKTADAADELNRKIYNFLQVHEKGDDIFLYLQPFKDIHLYGLNGDGSITYIYIFSTIAIFVLLIACINFMNLSTASSIKRAREIGLRKVVGADRLHLSLQFFGESVIYAILALLVAIIIVELLLPVFSDLSAKQLAFNPANGWLIPALSGLVLATGLIAGLYPAMFLSSFNPAKVLKGAAKSGSPFFRRVSVTLQFSLTVILIVCTLVVSNQLGFLRDKKLGFNKDNIVCIRMNNSLAEHYESFKNDLLLNVGVKSVTALSDKIGTELGISTDADEWEGNHGEKNMLLFRTSVDHDFDGAFGIELISGRFFSKDMASDTSAIILNETAVKMMGLEDPIGKEGPFKSEIIGVVKDFNVHPLNFKIEPLGLFMASDWYQYVAVKIGDDNIAGTLSIIEKAFGKHAPAFPFEYNFLQEDFDRLYKDEERLGTIFNYFAALAILISCLGLFGLATYSAEQRTKEIGIRKVLGASVSGIISLLSKEYLWLIGLANIIAWPIAYYAMNMWLQDFAYRTEINWWVFVLAGLSTVGIALLTILFKTHSAARANPVDSLKYE